MRKKIKLDYKGLRLFIVCAAFVGISIGFSHQLLPNYFKDAYDATAAERGFVEFPRELPGLLAMFVMAALASINDVRKAVIAQVLGAAGMLALGLLHPHFAIMSLFLFVFSMGQHMFLPLQDSLALQISHGENAGAILGYVNSVRMATLVLSGIITFAGFRWGWFTFETPVFVFLISAAAFVAAGILLFILDRRVKLEPPRAETDKPKQRWVFRKAYARFYFICAVFGGRKQIMVVFSPWVLIDLLGFKADTMSILLVIGAFIGVFFIPLVGRMCDRLGIKKVLMFESAVFFFVYVAYGFLSKWVSENEIVLTGIGMMAVYLLFIVDRMAEQFYLTRAIYIRSIAVDPSDVTPTLTLGMAIDHVVAIGGSAVCGLIWQHFGPEYVFLIAGVLAIMNFVAAAGIKTKKMV
ncbi:MAG: MFS transporter [Clostridiales Family XIII bacterium]|jgi:MFS family permease|nr:MFS transporter [Clostridiales Family XIII bacterium]